MSKPKQFDDSLALNETVGRLVTMNIYTRGPVLTPHGIVLVYMMIENPVARFEFVWQGRLYMRNIYRGYTAKGLARKARQFADEVVERGL